MSLLLRPSTTHITFPSSSLVSVLHMEADLVSNCALRRAPPLWQFDGSGVRVGRAKEDQTASVLSFPCAALREHGSDMRGVPPPRALTCPQRAAYSQTLHS
jgi:hypothetical protein